MKRFTTPKVHPDHPALQTGVSGTARNHFPTHVQNWANCDRCHLHDHATLHVLTRGSLPCDLLFIGEAPGPSEDVVGKPFVGRAGSVLDALLAETPATYNYRFCITNVIACFPQDTEQLPKKAFRKPRMLEAIKCRPRLTEVFLMAKPKAVILLGESAQEFAPPAFPPLARYMTLNLWHPSYLARQGGVKSLPYAQWRDEYLEFLTQVKTHARKTKASP